MAAVSCNDARAGSAAGRATKLFIGGLTRNTTTKLLREHFAQYGRILDCIAMVQADGKPRGFGYVTLDTPAAADRVLAEAQVIDGRAVDVKRAVRSNGLKPPAGGREPAAGGARRAPPGSWAGAYQEAWALQAAGAWPLWPDAGAAPDCLELLRGASGVPAFDAWGAGLLGADVGGLAWDSLGAGDAGESDLAKAVDAPEFVPAAAAGIEAPKKIVLPTAVAGRGRGTLGDITNTSLSGSKLASPMRLPVKGQLAPWSSPCKLPLPSGLGLDGEAKAWGFAAKRPSGLGIYVDDEHRSDGDECSTEASKENGGSRTNSKLSDVPPGLLLPPGLEFLGGESGEASPASNILSTVPTPKAALAR